MSDLIDRDVLLADLGVDLSCRRVGCCQNDRKCYNVLHSLGDFCDLIGRQPAVNVVPVRHGHWIPCSGKSHIYYCSACGGKISYNQARRTYKPINNQAVYEEHKFCRHCGAKMGEEVDRGEE